VPLFRAAGFGAVPGFLVAGVLVGPSGLALIDNVTEIGQLAELGVILLLFVIGIELRPARLWLMRRMVFGLGTLRKLGASLVVSENLEASLELAREAMIRDDGDANEAESLILRFRNSHYASVDDKGSGQASDQSGA